MADINREDDNSLGIQSDQNITNVVKMLEQIELSSSADIDIATYKAQTRKVFESLVLKLEEDSDQLYGLEHRVKYLEQECDSKDIQIEKITTAMQDAVDECRVEAEEMVEEMVRKVSVEVEQRRDVEMVVLRLQAENSRLKDTLRLQKLPGIEKSLDEVIQEVQERDAKASAAELRSVKDELQNAHDEIRRLKQQREAEMAATMSVVTAAHQKIEFLHHQLKALIHMREAEQRELQTTPSAKPDKREASTRSNEKDGKAVVPHRKRQGRNRNRGNRQSKGGDSAQSTPQSSATNTPVSVSATNTPVSVSASVGISPQSLSGEMGQQGEGAPVESSGKAKGRGGKKSNRKKSGGGGGEAPQDDGASLRDQSKSFWENHRLSK